ncbi:MAG: cysteine desulfurase CsdA [Bdellovibrionales bacterium CG12_big_fil_rev_8_21_14_0_65_38_15]|nr:MAG: cysteine desulfurase CsdA [Bdellovibrionales bacterium CG22_combo_CG10-13_8_21_14_all_38_13]PIQ57453.1 MAG: cysteine desulfurase CsdA [Bdellovibrionales bacterium CG12_big_fil_rev_8_21_14_0_65_38_15]PIR31174.1 MAG: cysteine desulfurase CsdA [Bdellovibrionales bacterium CG11_big_fil_rev_8_21_14_0_20_38_13]
MKTIEQIRADFPELERIVHNKTLIYLDNAASTIKCKSVIDAVTRHYSFDAANIHRGVHYLSETGTMQYESTRDALREFINSESREQVIFTKGTTESINLVAWSWGIDNLKKGDEIILTTLEHHSNIVPWQLVAERTGAKVVEAPVDDNGDIILSELKKKLNSNTKMVAFNLISNALGTINPVKEIIEMAKSVGAKTLVDAAQAIAHMKIDVQELDCDFLAFSSHKMFAPTGVGVLYGKKDLLNAMSPWQGGGDMIDVVTFEKTTYNELPHKFEAGTPHIAGVIGLKYAIEYIQEIGLSRIEEIEHELLTYATKKFSDIKGLKIIGTAKHKSAVISFVIDGLHPQDIGTILDQQGIAVRTGHHCTQPLMKRFGITGTTRASFCFYNTKEEIDKLVAGINKAIELLG